MNLEEAKEIFEQIIDLCYETENPRLLEIAAQIVRDIDAADCVSDIVRSAEELQVNIQELDFDEEEEDTVQEISELIEKLSE